MPSTRARLIATAGLAAVLVLCAFGAGPAPAAVNAARTPVVFVSFDEFPITSLLDRRGNLDARRYPGFAAFAATSTWFTDTTTVADGTRWATPIVVSGVYPRKLSIPAWFDYNPNLITLLAPTHRVHAVEPLTRLCPPRICGRRLPGRTRGQRARFLTALIPTGKQDALRHSALADLISTIRPWRTGKPPLYFIHVLLPHHPWIWLPDGRRYPPPSPEIPGLVGDNMWRNVPNLVDQGWKRHLLTTGYADLLMRRLVARLRSTGLWNRSLVAFSADHGVSFVARSSRRAATRTTVGGIAPVPFFLKAPGQRTAGRVTEHVQTIDILPTVADALGLPRPRRIDGTSALDPAFRPNPRVDLWATTSVRGFAHHSYGLAYVHRKSAQVLARQTARFGDGPFRGAFWRNPFAPVRR